MSKKKQTAPDTFVDEKQVDEETHVVTLEAEEPKDKEPDFNSGKWIVGKNAINGTRKGIIDVGEKVRPADFGRGIDQMKDLAESGAIVEAEK